MNTLYYGDNLDILRRYIPDETVDLIYLDPPFNSKANYNMLFEEHDGSKSAAQFQAFEDTWTWDNNASLALQEVIEGGGDVSLALQAFKNMIPNSGMLAYLSMMAIRLIELRRVLKPSGSIYLHCDPTASHYLKIIMDSIFGVENFRNEIVWRRKNAHNKLSKQFGPIHDIILFFTKSQDFYFSPGRSPYGKGYIKDYFPYSDEHGAYQSNVLTGSGIRNGDSGKEWRGYDPTKKGRHWAIPQKLTNELDVNVDKLSIQEVLSLIDEKGLILHPKTGESLPRYKQYLDTSEGILYQDIWGYQPGTSGFLMGTNLGIDEDVKWLEAENEKLGYQTQKPLGLLERIITSSSKPGDLVLDPFCGCGTAVVAAQKLGRQWIGIDITHVAITVMKRRLIETFEPDPNFNVIGEPTTVEDAAELAKSDPYQFQWWALGLVGARPIEQKKGADKGIDGRLYFHEKDGGETKQVIFSVKAGGTNASHVRDLHGVIDRENAAIGVLITMEEPTKPMRSEAASGGTYTSPWGVHPKLQILTVGELLDGKRIDMPPVHQVNVTYKRAPRQKKKGDQPTLV